MRVLQALYALPVRTVVGLMSGTSADGIDAAVVRIAGSGTNSVVDLLAFETYPYPPGLRQRVFAAFDGGVRQICELNFLLGEAFAEAAIGVVESCGMTTQQIDLVGSHGQTIYHIPQAACGVASTLQIGEPSVIVERLGVPCVYDFRTRDVAAGGDGAPLVPYVDHLLYGQPGRIRWCQNIGGIGNASVVTEDIANMLAFDTGPGNMLIDQVVEAITGEAGAIDRDGKLSALGEVDSQLLAELLDHEYLRQPPPKSTGREQFGRVFGEALLHRWPPDRLLDLLATLVRFTAESIALAYERFIAERLPVHEVVVSGGGVHNQTLMAALKQLFAPIPVFPLEVLGLPSDAKEAVAFAILANEYVAGNPSNVPAATGARRRVVLGKLAI